jgi:acyl transferase domain-containing protein/acyl carrier protein
MQKVYKYIIDNVTSDKMDRKIGAQILKMLTDEGVKPHEDIAVIGIGARLPFAENIEEHWTNIRNGIHCMSRFPEKRKDDTDRYIVACGMEEYERIRYGDGSYLESIDGFDYKFFRISPKEASVMDPYQRIFLQTVWQAFEDAGYGGKKLGGSKTGVFVGYASNVHDAYIRMVYESDKSLMSTAAIGNITAMIPTRIAYLMDLQGPTMVIDTACSSSLVAVHQACNSIRQGDCDLAVAGGIKINLLPIDNEYTRVGFESSDGYTRSFDEYSDGTGKGEGVLAVVLKPLSKARKDRDHIYALIKGGAINQDGTSMGITAPNPDAQIDVITKAWEDAGIDPCTLSYIEVHGTGTKLGDPIEVDSLHKAFKKYTDRKQFCPIGTLKPAMGHMYECSGLAGFLNAVMALKHKEIPPMLHLNKPNAAIDFCSLPIYVNTKFRRWEREDVPMRCAVSSFGVSGTNCHMVLEEAPEEKAGTKAQGPQILTFSAKSRETLEALIAENIRFLQKEERVEVGDYCFTANTGRGHYNHRLAVIVHTQEELKNSLLKLSHDLEKDGKRIFYREHKVVSGNKESRSQGEITEAERYALSKSAGESIRQFNNNQRQGMDLLSEICRLYVQGADIDWDAFYKGKERKKISIPVYPFENERCWVDLPDVNPASQPENDDATQYAIFWKQEDRNTGNIMQKGTVMVLGDEDSAGEKLSQGILQAFKEAGREVIEVKTGPEFKKTGDSTYSVETSRDGFIKLMEEVKERKPAQIIHLLTLGNREKIADRYALEKSQKRACYSLYYLIKAFLHWEIKDAIDIVLISKYVHEVTGDEERFQPENASLFGFGKSVNKEYAHLKCRCIELDETTPVKELLSELEYTGNDYIAAYRKGQRYVEVFGEIREAEYVREGLVIRDEGVYVITGGTGGIGLEIARFLASKSRVNLALLNRSVLPDRQEWESILTAGEGGKDVEKIRVLKEIEAKGAKVTCYSVDIANEKEVKSVLKSIREKYGNINGIIHGAGIALDCPLAEKEEAAFNQVISPKIYGTWILDRLTQQDKMDFFVMFSSVATVFTMFGQGDYAAANAYLDSFAALRSKQGKRTLTINWTTWKETGMAYRSGFCFDTIFRTLPTAKGIEGFSNVLEKFSNYKRVLIGQINYGGVGNSLLERSGVKLSREILQKMSRYKKQVKTVKTVPVAGSSEEVQLTGRDSGKYTEVEWEIAETCKKVLGFSEINVYDNFFEMGADSILLIKIQAELGKKLPVKIAVVDMFEHSTVSKLAEYIVAKDEKAGKKFKRIAETVRTGSKDIAIIGMALKFPKAATPDDFWDNIRNGLDCVTDFPEARRKDVDRYVKFKNHIPINSLEYDAGAYLEGVDSFDYSYFRIPPKEASLTDPNHRLFLQTAWEAIEDAGYGGNKITGTNTGVYLGFAPMQLYFLWMINDVEPSSQMASLVGNTSSVATGRLSYLFDLKGPSMVVDTACSASLTAVHLACRSLRNGDCDMAVAGGVKINLLPVRKKGSPRGIGMESGDGRTRTFDDNADGTGSGEGAAVVLLKPLHKAVEDRDHIYAVIKGSASNQDGSSAGITAPNPAAQEEVIVKAWEDAGIDPETIFYIEAHGTGTQLGDPIEIKGIQSAFERYTLKKQFCAVGSVKTNIAHLSEAAGIAGLIKAVLALRNKEIPPSLFLNRPNRKIPFNDSSVYINTVARKWETPGHPRRCGVSGFGMSGTNCHVVLEEYVETREIVPEEGPHVLTLSAKSEGALKTLLGSYREFFSKEREFSLQDLCYTANTGRKHYNYRLAVIAHDTGDLKQKMETLDRKGYDKVKEAWVYGGQHKVVPEEKGKKEEGEITGKYRMELGQKARWKLEEWKTSGGSGTAQLEELCRLYSLGATVEWEELYAGREPGKMSVPTYPFEVKRCWLDIPERDDEQAEGSTGGRYHFVVWVKENLPERAEQAVPGAVLIFKDGGETGEVLAERFKGKGREVILVKLGDRYEKKGDGSYRIKGTEEDYLRLFKEIKSRKPATLLHLFTEDAGEDADTPEELEEIQKLGVYSLFYIIKAIAAAGIRRNIDIVLISRQVEEVSGAEDFLNPWNMPLFGLGKGIRQENANLQCRCIDIDGVTGVETLLREITTGSDDYHVAYRKGERYVDEVREIDLEDRADRKIEVREEGIYLITGGTGGMGIAISRYLAAKNKVNIALVGRSEMPEPKVWDAVVKSGMRKDKKTIGRIEAIRGIESLGAKVEYYSADVVNMERMTAIFGKLREEYGRINGVVHAAGLAGGGFLFDKDEKAFNEVLQPKVRGTWILDRLTQEDEPDFFINCSSVASMFPGKGQSDYAAANACLDSYASYKKKQGKRALTINWAAWRDTGMAVDYGVNVDSTFKVLPTGKAIRALDQALNRDIFRVQVGELNYGSDDLAALDRAPVRLAPPIREAVNRAVAKLKARLEGRQKKIEASLKLTGKVGEEYSAVEKKLAGIYSEVLGFEEIDIYDNFFELGGDSVMLGKVHFLVEQEFPGKVSLMDLFSYTSIVKLSERIAGIEESNEPENEKKAKMEDKLDADIERQLDDLLGNLEGSELLVDEVLKTLKEIK